MNRQITFNMDPITITVAIPAFNEAKNIQNMLKTVMDQKIDNDFKLERIIVVSDGSNDATVEKVQALNKYMRIIEVIDHKDRKGKVARLNEIYKLNKSDILMIFDGDIVLGTKKSINEMSKILKNEKDAVMVAAHQIPIKGKTFVSKVIYAGYKVWDDARLAVPNQDHIQNFYGAATAYRKSFSNKLFIPKSITDERGYLYFLAKEKGGFRYTENAEIYYRPVDTIHDIRKLADRSFSKNQIVLSKLFGNKVFEMYVIPTKYKIYSIIKNMINDPFFTLLGLIMNILLRLFPEHDNLYDKGAWEMSTSTKEEIKL
jgi:glycosyltransferase involved in cell wall biosynthesis